ncbi:MAG: TSUP family transporter [Chitinophagaceae bacterium]
MISTIIILCIAAFAAGFVDAIVGGGGLIQLPVAFIMLPQYPVHSVVGTLKIPAFTGTFFASIQYLRRVAIKWKLMLACGLTAFAAAITGSYVLSLVSSSFMKPVILCILVVVAIYTFTKKDFGQHTEKEHSQKEWMAYGISIGLFVGFYDGFIGPGAGSILILIFISILGFDFLKASAHAKLVNLCTNMGSIIFFVLKGTIIYKIAIPMAIANGLGGMAGARLAILKGNKFVRIFFLVVVTATIIRFAYDIFFK